MSVIFDGNKNIDVTRGDTQIFQITGITVDGVAYTLGVDDTIRFTVRKTPKTDSIDDNYIFQIVTHTNTITIPSSTTKDLSYGTYHYDIEVELGDGTVCTPKDYSWKEYRLGKESS